VSRLPQCAEFRLAVLALAGLLAACAQTPTEPTSSLPDKVIHNDPSAKSAKAAGKPAATVPSLPAYEPPPDDNMPMSMPMPVAYADVLDRIRAGMQLPDVDQPSVRAELDWYVRNSDYMERVLLRGQRYLYYIANEVQARGMPMELALLPIVESAFNPFAYSRSHASGLWQFIPVTGKRFELKQDWWQDQRRDVMESTRAALDYLAFLNQKFDGDWLLAIAAYNSGGGNVARAVTRNQRAGRGTDFFSLDLPRETRAYVPKLLALSEMLRRPEAYGVVLPVVPDVPYFEVVDTGGPVDLRLAANLAGVDVEELHALNAGWNQWVTGPDGPNRLLVPTVVAQQFVPQLQALDLQARAGLTQRSVASGDTLQGLASQYRVPVSFLQSVNNMNGSRLTAGDALYVPGGNVAPLRSGLVRSATSLHTVRSGDTLWEISRRYGMSVKELASANGISAKSTLRPGQKLAVRPQDFRSGPTIELASTDEPRQVDYRVRKGDTLSGIARRFAVSVSQLQAWNDLGDTSIRTGQRLTIHVDGGRDFGG
jgi:membrane-bound lytic murein transglycosylase D